MIMRGVAGGGVARGAGARLARPAGSDASFDHIARLGSAEGRVEASRTTRTRGTVPARNDLQGVDGGLVAREMMVAKSLVVLLAAALAPATAWDNGAALTPTRGWQVRPAPMLLNCSL